MTGRTQVVEISYLNEKDSFQGKVQSTPKKIETGVPQGSILGPLLFLLYINDLPSHIEEATLVLYADDTNILVTGSDEEELNNKISVVTHQLDEWLKYNELVVNSKKTVAISFQYRKAMSLRPKIYIQNSMITYKSEVKFLGIIIMENLYWQSHIKTLSSALSKTYYMIRILKQSVSTHMLWNVYYAQFQSKIRYGILLWGRSEACVKILRIQKKVIRMITGLKKGDSCKKKFRELGILTVTSLYVLEVLCYMRKHARHIPENSAIHDHNTRQKTDLHIHTCRTASLQKSVINTGIRLFNHLPIELKHILEPKQFKRKLKLHLLNHPLYSLKEFFEVKINK